MIIYLHGFRSSPASTKAKCLKNHLSEKGLSDQFWCEELPIDPALAIERVEQTIATNPAKSVLIGSSLGGYYATYLAEQHGLKALLINPAVQPHLRFDGYLGPQKNYYSDETWDLTEDHVQALAELDVAPPSDPTRYQIWLQTGDETLDYRDAEQYYRACALRIQAGGDHGFQGFAERLPAIFAFAGISATLWRDTDFSVFN
jgi:predicted esterase YcpF (UPF0227 family)